MAILNGWFGLGFFGAPGFTALAAGMHLRAAGRGRLVTEGRTGEPPPAPPPPGRQFGHG